MLNIGDIAPDFELKDQDGESFNFYPNKEGFYAVLYFYPKDDTPGCTAQSCSFRDNSHKLKELGAKIVGVSADDASSHKDFQSKYKLPFPLLSDTQGKVSKLYQVKKTFGLLPGRVTYLISPENKIMHAFSSQMQIQKHVDNVVEWLESEKAKH